MVKILNFLTSNKKRKKSIKNNKKFWKWTRYNSFLILFGISVIVNITYLPKYFLLKNHQEQIKNEVLNVNISAYDENNQKLFVFHYQTIFTILGNLLTQDSNTYVLKDFGGILGKYLFAVKYYDKNQQQQIKSATNSSWWAIYYNGVIADAGIDRIYLNSNDKIEFIFKTN